MYNTAFLAFLRIVQLRMCVAQIQTADSGYEAEQKTPNQEQEMIQQSDLDRKPNKAKIIIGGDVCPVEMNSKLFIDGNAESILSDIIPIMNSCDLRVVNLECPMINKASPLKKSGPVLGVRSESVNGLVEMKVDIVNLANNHILDHSEEGLQSTIEAISKAGILHFGAGPDLKSAQQVLIKPVGDMLIGFMGIAEVEYNVSKENKWGTNYVDIIDNVNSIKKIRPHVDILIILLHSGTEYYQYPSPRLQKYCRYMVDEGADVVICQHSHCVGSYEKYQQSIILYGQGNFVFNRYNKRSDSFYDGLLVELSINKMNDINVEWIPIKQEFGKEGVRLAKGLEKENILNGLHDRSHEIVQEGFIQDKWREYCLKEKYSFANSIYGYNRYLSSLNKRLHFSDWINSSRRKLLLRNIIQCELHRDVLISLWRDMEEDI